MSDFKSYIFQEGVLSTTAGITIGLATVTFIKSLVADVILPVVFLIMVKATGSISKDASGFFAKFLSKKEFMFTNFMSELVTWILIVVSALLILDAIYTHYIQKKPLISQETLTKPFNVTQEFLTSFNPFTPPTVPSVPAAPSVKPAEYFEPHQQEVLWGASD